MSGTERSLATQPTPLAQGHSSLLRNAALQIVAAARPFPPLPPSFLASSPTLTVLVPIEFDANH